MPTAKKKIDLFNSPEGLEIRAELSQMEQDNTYITESSYTADCDKYPNKRMPFIETHLTYLNKHAEVNPGHYLSNLRLMLRVR